jgi:hypothetical protein
MVIGEVVKVVGWQRKVGGVDFVYYVVDAQFEFKPGFSFY